MSPSQLRVARPASVPALDFSKVDLTPSEDEEEAADRCEGYGDEDEDEGADGGDGEDGERERERDASGADEGAHARAALGERADFESDAGSSSGEEEMAQVPAESAPHERARVRIDAADLLATGERGEAHDERAPARAARPAIPSLALGKAAAAGAGRAGFDDEFARAMADAPPSADARALGFETTYERALAEGPGASARLGS